MSYCRWSSDDYQCDVYVWADIAGTWRTEVAGRRPVFTQPMPPRVALPVGASGSPEREAWARAWVERERLAWEAMGDSDEWTFVDLPTPEGGTSYEHSTPGECADNLERLRGLGFNVPQSAIDALREDEK